MISRRVTLTVPEQATLPFPSNPSHEEGARFFEMLCSWSGSDPEKLDAECRAGGAHHWMRLAVFLSGMLPCFSSTRVSSRGGRRKINGDAHDPFHGLQFITSEADWLLANVPLVIGAQRARGYPIGVKEACKQLKKRSDCPARYKAGADSTMAKHYWQAGKRKRALWSITASVSLPEP